MYSGRASSRRPRYLNWGLMCPNLGLIVPQPGSTWDRSWAPRRALEAQKPCKTHGFTMCVAMPKEPPRAPREAAGGDPEN